MHTTPASLLERLRRPGERDAWDRFVELYTPLLFRWAQQRGLQAPDASDLVQEVLTTLLQKLPEFSYDRHKSFRSWLRTILLNKYRNAQRRPAPLSLEVNAACLACPDEAGDLAETEYRLQLVSRALQIIQGDFLPATWQDFWEYMVRGRPAAEVAAEHQVPISAIYLAKSRVMSRLRQELNGLLE